MPSALVNLRLAGLLLLFTALCFPIIRHQGDSNYTWDETNYYLPAIQLMNSDWPRLDVVRHSLSATSPGYLYCLAGVSRFVGTGRSAMRWANFAVSASVLVVLWLAWPAPTPDSIRFASLLPLTASNFFVKSSSFVVTDNAALLAVATTLVLIQDGRSRTGLIAAGGTAACAVFFRQINLWLCAPVLLLGLLKRRPLIWTAVIPSVSVITWLFLTWGGLVPPAWRSVHEADLAFSAVPYQLSVLGGLGLFFYAASIPAWRTELNSRWVIGGATLGLLAATVGATFPSMEAGRWGGYLWNIAGLLPIVEGRSVLFLLSAPLGGVLLALCGQRLWREAGSQAALLWLGSVAGFFATGIFNRQVFHRYYEPTVLVLLIVWLNLLSSKTKLRWTPLAFLGLVQLVITLATAHARTFGLLD